MKPVPCSCPGCEEDQSDGHGYEGGESSSGLCYACELAGCSRQVAQCLDDSSMTPERS